jgi:hypothetical protein
MDTAVSTGLKVDLGCGQNRREGFHGIDIVAGLYEDDYTVCDLFREKWPFDDDSVSEAFSSHVVEHAIPVGGWHDGLCHFMNELYRVLEPEGTATIIHPYCKSNRAFQDPTHSRYIPEETWWYFNREARENMGLGHYPITSDFEVVNIGQTFVQELSGDRTDWGLRSNEAIAFAVRHYVNVIADLSVDLKALK